MMRIQASRIASALTSRPMTHPLHRIVRRGATLPSCSPRGCLDRVSSLMAATKTRMIPVRRSREIARGARLYSDKNAARLEDLAGAYSINVSSWFCVPDYMSTPELLSRGSAFLIPWRGSALGSPGGGDDQDRLYHVVTSAHVIHPFAFPHYYEAQMEWLQKVKEEHVTCRMEVRNAAGGILMALPLRPKVHRHASRDIAVLHSPDDAFMIDELDQYGRHALSLASEPPAEGDALSFIGHSLTDEGTEEEQRQKPLSVGGLLVGRGGAYTFARTTQILQMGMCGGPVVAPDGSCVGMTEAIVSDAGPKELRGLAVVIEGDTIAPFLSEVADWEEENT